MHSLLRRILVGSVVLAATLGTVQSGVSPSCPTSQIDAEYVQVLDAYFAHADGNSNSAAVLRVYGAFTPEYELVLDPAVSRHSIMWYEPKKSIWGGAYDLTSKHKSIQDYVSGALTIPFNRRELEVSGQQFSEFLTKAGHIDTSMCQHFPLRNSKGQEVLVADAPWLELILDSGRKRAKVTNTSDFKDIVSQNPALLEWATDVQKIVRAHLGASAH